MIFLTLQILKAYGFEYFGATDPNEMDIASSNATEIFIKLFGDEIFVHGSSTILEHLFNFNGRSR